MLPKSGLRGLAHWKDFLAVLPHEDNTSKALFAVSKLATFMNTRTILAHKEFFSPFFYTHLIFIHFKNCLLCELIFFQRYETLHTMAKVALIQEEGVLAGKIQSFIKNQPGLQLIHASNKAASLLEERIRSFPPDILLIDIPPEGKNNLEILPEIKLALPHAKFMAMTCHLDPEMVLEAVNKGADSYFIKNSGLQELGQAIQVTIDGGAYLHPQAAKVIVGFCQKISSDKSRKTQFPLEDWAGKGMFVPREVQVIKGLLDNQSYKEIASTNHVGINTVRYYVKSVYRKLDINSKSQLWLIFRNPVPE